MTFEEGQRGLTRGQWPYRVASDGAMRMASDLKQQPQLPWTRGEFGRHFGSIFELGKCVVKCSVVR